MTLRNGRISSGWVWSAMAAAVVGVVPAAVWADGFIVIDPPQPVVRIRPTPRPWPIPRPHLPLEVRRHRVDVEIQDNLAVTKIDQVFYNPSNRQLEGTYIFPLPDDVAVQRFSMFMGGKEVEGEVLDKDKARQIYQDIVSRSKDPALLEYVGTRMYRARVFPIPANGEVEIKLDYSQVVEVTGGLATYRYPLNTEKFSSAPLGEVAVRVRLQSQLPLASVFCPSHDASIDRKGEHEATVGYEEKNVLPDKDFIVGYQVREKEFGLALVMYRERGDDGYFMARIVPATEWDRDRIVAKDIAFVIDTSGSMSGDKIEQARQALRFCLENLGRKDRFTIIPFATEVNPYRENLIAATKENVDEARRFVSDLPARGGTNINDALQTALKSRRNDDGGRPFMVIFLTDGLPTIGETDIDRILKNVKSANPGDVRLFVFGVGNDVNTRLLDKLAEDNRGARQYVAPQEDLEVKLSNFYGMIAHPVLGDLKLSFGGAGAFDVYPKTLPDLFLGSELVVFGRYKAGGTHSIRLEGRRGDESVHLAWEKEFAERERRSDYLPRLWASRKIGYLLDEIRMNGETSEVKEEIVRLAKKFGILTPYTSFLVLEEDELDRARGRTVRAPAAMGALRRGSGDSSSRYSYYARDFNSQSGEGAVGASRALKQMQEPASSAEIERQVQLFAAAAPTDALGGIGGARFGAATQPGDMLAVAQQSPVRFVGSRTFYLDGERWVDSGYDGQGETVKLTMFSDEYFRLVAANPETGKYFALGPKVIVLVDGKVYETVPE